MQAFALIIPFVAVIKAALLQAPPYGPSQFSNIGVIDEYGHLQSLI